MPESLNQIVCEFMNEESQKWHSAYQNITKGTDTAFDKLNPRFLDSKAFLNPFLRK